MTLPKLTSQQRVHLEVPYGEDRDGVPQRAHHLDVDVFYSNGSLDISSEDDTLRVTTAVVPVYVGREQTWAFAVFTLDHQNDTIDEAYLFANGELCDRIDDRLAKADKDLADLDIYLCQKVLTIRELGTALLDAMQSIGEEEFEDAKREMKDNAENEAAERSAYYANQL